MKKIVYFIGGYLLYKIFDIYIFKYINEYVLGLFLFDLWGISIIVENLILRDLFYEMVFNLNELKY